MIEKIIEFKARLEAIKNDNNSETASINKADICQILVMLNVAEMCIRSNIEVPKEFQNYFEGQAFVGRYFSDWNLSWVAWEYLEVTEYIKHNHWFIGI